MTKEKELIARRREEYMWKRREAGMDYKKKPLCKVVNPANYFEDPAHPWVVDGGQLRVTDHHRAFVQDSALALNAAQYIAFELGLPLTMLFRLFGDVIENAEELAKLQQKPRKPGHPVWYFDRPKLLQGRKRA